ncbi:hypothetical protein QBC36DRAFT_197745 [Triangularia setosa]|uniref:Uncharacterized protein n=1 Tax=Triangularia setosa TaxID=2587417 RepID=A0AAN6VYH5_9PEZI|nr:hypothetical protein QBC36DRAFT_197745 [Podospora setosa]
MSKHHHYLDIPSAYHNLNLAIASNRHGNCEGQYYTNKEDVNFYDGDGFFDDRISSWICY